MFFSNILQTIQSRKISFEKKVVYVLITNLTTQTVSRNILSLFSQIKKDINLQDNLQFYYDT